MGDLNMKNVFFDPWVGKNYQTGGVFGKKLLILGESHHCGCGICENACGDMQVKSDCDINTTDIILDYLNDYANCGSYKTTYCKFERALINKYTNAEDSQAIWDSVAFYNYLQRAMSRAREFPKSDDWGNSNNAFFEVLEYLKPDYIITWGRRLWQNLPMDGCEGAPVICEGLPNERTWEYTLSDGRIVKMMSVYHPSGGFSWDRWHMLINEFITKH